MAARPGPKSCKGIPDGQTVNVVREDPKRKGLLFAGTERAVYVSFDDGENWQSLRLEYAGDFRSGSDHQGRRPRRRQRTDAGFGFSTTSRRCVSSRRNRKSDAILFKPQTALRVRWNLNTDTPLPPDEPAGENPPDGAMIDYFLAEEHRGR